jgi:ADP-ribose pyrophosphatase
VSDTSSPPCDTDRVKILQTETVYDSIVKVDRLQLQTLNFDNTWTQAYERHTVRFGPTGLAACGLLYDPVQDKVVLVEQFRLPHYLQNDKAASSLEIVAGLIESAEAAEATFRREAVEEAGYTIGRCQLIGNLLASPGVFLEKLFIFVGEVNAPSAETIHGLESEHENIKLRLFDRAEIIAQLDAGTITDLKTAYALSWLARHSEALQAAWR